MKVCTKTGDETYWQIDHWLALWSWGSRPEWIPGSGTVWSAVCPWRTWWRVGPLFCQFPGSWTALSHWGAPGRPVPSRHHPPGPRNQLSWTEFAVKVFNQCYNCVSWTLIHQVFPISVYVVNQKQQNMSFVNIVMKQNAVLTSSSIASSMTSLILMWCNL